MSTKTIDNSIKKTKLTFFLSLLMVDSNSMDEIFEFFILNVQQFNFKFFFLIVSSLFFFIFCTISIYNI